MKNIIRYTSCILFALVIGACRDEDLNPFPDVTRSSIPVFSIKEGDTGFIDIYNLDWSHVAFDVDRLGTEEVVSVDVWVQFNNSETGEAETIEYTTVSTFPSGKFDLTFTQLLELFPEEVVTRDTISIGDSFVVGANALLADGRYLTGGYSPSVAANHQVTITYPVTCSSDLAGTYDLTLVYGVEGEDASVPDVTITEISAGYYELSEVTMDIFQNGLGPVKYRFRELCGSITADPESVDYGGQITVRFNPGSGVDEATGVITFAVEYIDPSCCGLSGIKTTFTATPK